MLVIGPILWGHSGPLCHALSLLLLWTSILHCHSPVVATVARRLRYSWLRLILVVVSTVATPDEWQCKIRTGGVRWLAVANGPNIFQMLLVCTNMEFFYINQHIITKFSSQVSSSRYQKFHLARLLIGEVWPPAPLRTRLAVSVSMYYVKFCPLVNKI